MLISDVIDHAKSRFSLLLTGDKEIQGFLTQALTVYQDLAGCIRKEIITAYNKEGQVLPDSFLAVAMVKDSYNDFVPSMIIDDDTGGQKLFVDKDAKYPLVLEYFVHLTSYANKPDSHIPNRIAGLITDYLALLISIDNNDRIARAEGAGKMDTSRTLTATDLSATKQALEEQFRMSRAIVPMCSILPR